MTGEIDGTIWSSHEQTFEEDSKQRNKGALPQRLNDKWNHSTNQRQNNWRDIQKGEKSEELFRHNGVYSRHGASISEHFVGFVDVQDNIGKGLCDTLLEKLGGHDWQCESCALLPAIDHASIACSPNPLSAEEGHWDNVHSNQHKGWVLYCAL